MPYKLKSEKAAQMRRYRARKRMERTARLNHPANAPVQRPPLMRPQHPSRIESQPSPFSVLKQAMDGLPKPTNAPTAMRYGSVAAIPPEVLAKYGITKQGSNALSAGPGVDVQAVLRRLLTQYNQT